MPRVTLTSPAKLSKARCGIDCWFELCNPRKSSNIVFWRQKDLTSDMGKSEILSFLLGWVLDFRLTRDNTYLSWGNDKICLASVRRQDLTLTLGANLDWIPQNVFISKLDLWDLGGRDVFTMTGACCTCHLPHVPRHPHVSCASTGVGFLHVLFLSLMAQKAFLKQGILYSSGERQGCNSWKSLQLCLLEVLKVKTFPEM